MSRERSFEGHVAQLEEALLKSISQPCDVRTAVVHFMRGSFPSSVTENQGAAEPKALAVDDKVVFRHSVRTLLDTVVRDAASSGAPLMAFAKNQGSQPTVLRLLDLVLWMCDHEIVEPGMIFTLLTDVVEAATIDECRDVFTYIEEKVPILRKPHLFDGKLGGKLIMLRCCNQLLRRLSKGNNALLCGRISMLLAWLLPIWEKSGVNPTGLVNLSNPLVVEEVEDGATDSNGAPIDVEFYRVFWGLQKHFQAPLAVLEQDNWESFCSGLGRVLEVFGAQPLTSGESNSLWSEGSVKYLTSSRLIHLQLQDPSFRRQFLVQCLILFHFVRNPVLGKEKKATPKPHQLEQASSLEKKVIAQIGTTPECGPDFADSVQKLLQRESAWVAWKADGAPAFDRPPATLYVPPDGPKRKKARSQVYKIQLGTQELDDLWNLTESNTSSLHAEDRGHLPTCQEFMEDVIEQMNPEEGIEDEYKRKNDKVYKWKALRMIARQNLQVFSDTIEKADGDLEYSALNLYPEEIKGVNVEEAMKKYATEPKKVIKKAEAPAAAKEQKADAPSGKEAGKEEPEKA